MVKISISVADLSAKPIISTPQVCLLLYVAYLHKYCIAGYFLKDISFSRFSLKTNSTRILFTIIKTHN